MGPGSIAVAAATSEETAFGGGDTYTPSPYAGQFPDPFAELFTDMNRATASNRTTSSTAATMMSTMIPVEREVSSVSALCAWGSTSASTTSEEEAGGGGDGEADGGGDGDADGGGGLGASTAVPLATLMTAVTVTPSAVERVDTSSARS